MKLTLATAISAIVLSTAAHAGEAYPAYTKDKSAWWVSAIFLVPVAGLDAVGRAIEVTGKDKGAFEPLHRATVGIAKNAAEGPCGVPGVKVIPGTGSICK